MSVDPIPPPPPPPVRPGAFVHPLLRARDWQDRPEFGDLCQWWRVGGVGVCALVGIGGAGKTAIVERFLQILPGGYPKHPLVSKDSKLPAPVRLLVFSFYDAPNVDTFFAELADWLEGYPAATPRADAESEDVTRLPSYQRTLQLLAGAERCLLVLDGLEKVQDDGSRGGILGQILDGRLRDFVLRAADGYVRASLVITSRFRLYDPLSSRTWYYLQIPIEQLQPTAAVQLLRDRGVRGTDNELEHVAHEQGFHALSVDLAGGYIARFCGGDSEQFSLFNSVQSLLATEVNPAIDPQIAAIREQEHKFARLTERYYETLIKSDPAALSLLQRVCLFRLGVEAKILASIFVGKAKERISGFALARLDRQQLQSKLQLLVEMRLIETSKSQDPDQESQIYTIHPAVRDGFLKTLDAETARLGHNAVRAGLAASLSGLPGRSASPSDSTVLDLLEEIVYHTLAAGHSQAAWAIYRTRIGGYRNLLWRLGAYERGERICRAFVAGQSPQTSPLPRGLSENSQVLFINEWALYLQSLGQLTAAAHCYELGNDLDYKHENWVGVAIGNINLADVFLLAGHLAAGLHATEASLRLAESLDVTPQRLAAYAYRGYARALRGEVAAATSDFRAAIFLHKELKWSPVPVLRSIWGIHHSLLLTRLGRKVEATTLATSNIKSLEPGDFDQDRPKLVLILSDLARERGDLLDARMLLHEAYDWSLRRCAKEPLCWSALIRAKIELTAFSSQRSANSVDSRVNLKRAALALEEGLHIARECSYGIYYIDLLLLRAQLALHEGRATDAERDVRVALDEGVHPPAESGYPELLAATDPECLYVWGIAEGHQLLAEALLLQAAQKHGQAEFVPKRLDRLPADVRNLIAQARVQLNQSLELWRKLRDPESDAEINPKGERTKSVLEDLDGGILTEYSLEPVPPEQPAATQPLPESPAAESVAPASVRRTKTVPKKKHLFLSYCRDNRAEVSKLHGDLVAAGEAVWWDQEILGGQDWKHEIRKAMRDAYTVVLCLSTETADRITSGVYPEVLDAIAAYREYAPGSVFLIPVRLSDCEIPLIEIDGTRKLDRLQYVDLFPASQRASGLQQLVKSLKAAPLHP